MKAKIFTVTYVDKHAAALVYRKISEIYDDSNQFGIIAFGLERFKTKSRRNRSHLKLNLVVTEPEAKNLPNTLKIIHALLSEHPLFPYLSLDYTAVPMSQTEWNFDSYDDPHYQKIFIRKREKD